MLNMKPFLTFFLLTTTLAPDSLASGERSRGMIRRVGEPPVENITVTPMIGPSAALNVEVGVKGSYRVADRGFIPVINNSVAIEGGVFVGPKHLVIEPLLRWDFHVHPEWTVYPSAGAAFVVGDLGSHGFFPATFTAGAIWRPTGSSWTFRGEADWLLGSLRAGPMFFF
jgi:hypothetical protein